ncbi:multiple inositol polyphosphate phosphatase 1-like [Asterias amurensis]|uniref:multiple inositol polyphosphate phosphatase 1-like n=1 Tax=Asterias amurensis TaxID=7602 RepID=UPI003AB3860F
MTGLRSFLGATLTLGFLCTVFAQMPLFSTETGYDLIFSTAELAQRQLTWLNLARQMGVDAPEGVENCSLIGLYMVIREGTTFPSEADTMALNSLQQRMRSQPINSALRYLKQVPDSRLPMNMAGKLSEAGRQEMKMIAMRLKSRFTELFSGPDIDLSLFNFQSMNTTASIESAVAFVQGLVGENQICETISSEMNVTVNCQENPRTSRVSTPTSAYIPNQPISMDSLLRPYITERNCLSDANKGRTNTEVRAFQMGREMAQLTQKIVTKFTPPRAQPWNITQSEVQLLSKICGFHNALFKDNSTWCQLFEYEDLNVAEYERELQHYWDESYGFPVNSRVACPLINDTFEYLEGFTARNPNSNLPVMSMKFTDENTLLRLISLLGINRDQQQLAANNYARNRNREFRSAKMAPFAGNLAINLFRCQEAGGIFFSDQTYRVNVMLNELPVNVTYCPNGLCDINVFKNGFMKQAGQCLVDKECHRAIRLGPNGGGGLGGGSRAAASSFAQSPLNVFFALAAIVAAKIGYGGL